MNIQYSQAMLQKQIDINRKKINLLSEILVSAKTKIQWLIKEAKFDDDRREAGVLDERDHVASLKGHIKKMVEIQTVLKRLIPRLGKQGVATNVIVTEIDQSQVVKNTGGVVSAICILKNE